MSSLADLRQTYQKGTLEAPDLAADPLDLFARWFADAQAAGTHEPNVMTLATSTPDGRPSARIVLLKAADARGFSFYTNLESRKGQEMDAHPLAALVFWWPALERQVRVEGRVVRVVGDEADTYYESRPRESRLGAWASPQSRTIPDRSVLDERLAAVTAEYDGADVPRPPFWGGYRVVPDVIEFWQGRPSRLHDRFCYTRGADGWSVTRLAP